MIVDKLEENSSKYFSIGILAKYSVTNHNNENEVILLMSFHVALKGGLALAGVLMMAAAFFLDKQYGIGEYSTLFYIGAFSVALSIFFFVFGGRE